MSHSAHPSQFFQSIYQCWCDRTNTPIGTSVYATIRWLGGDYPRNEVWDIKALADPNHRFWASVVASYEAKGMDAHIVWASLGLTKEVRSKQKDLSGADFVGFVIEDDDPMRGWDTKINDWQRFGFPEPSMQVWTGSKSIHHIYLCRDANLEALYGCFQQYARASMADGFDYQDSYVNAFKVKTTRVPGIKHSKTGTRSQLLGVNKPYKFSQLWDAISARQIGRWEKKENRFLSIQEEAQERADKERALLERQAKVSIFIPHQQSVGLSIGDSSLSAIALQDCLVGRAKEYWLNGASHGERFSASGTVLSQLLATENFLQSHAIPAAATAYDCWREWGVANHLNQSEIIARWRSMSGQRDKYILNAPAIRQVARLTGGSVQEKTTASSAWTVGQLIDLAKEIAAQAHALGITSSAFPITETPSPKATASQIQVTDIKKALAVVFTQGKLTLGEDIIIPVNAIAEARDLASLPVKVIAEINDTNILLAKALANTLTIYAEDCGICVPLLYLQVARQEEPSALYRFSVEFLGAKQFEGALKFSRLVAIKSPLGSGKTTALKSYLEQHKEKRALVIYARQALSEAIAAKLSLPCYSDGHPYLASLIEQDGGVYCLHSLKSFGMAQFNPSVWGDSEDLLILDEAEGTLTSLLEDENVSIEARQNFIQLLKNFSRSGGSIVVMDANLSRSSIELLQKLTGLEAATLVNNYAPSQPRKLFVIKDNKTLQSELIKSASSQKVAYACDRRHLRKSNNGSTQLMREFLSANAHTVTIDSHTQHTTDDRDYQCLDNPESLSFRTGALIYSPTIESGYSIDKSSCPFEKVFASFDGAISIDSATQMLARVRDDAPRYLVARKSAVGSARDLDLEVINARASASIAAHRSATENIGALTETLEEFILAYREYKALIKAIEGRNYREVLVYKLVSSGYYRIAEVTSSREVVAIEKGFAEERRDAEISATLSTEPIEPKSEDKNADLPIETQRAHAHYRFNEWVDASRLDQTQKARTFNVWDSARRSKVDFCVAFLQRSHEENEVVLVAKALNPDNGMMLSLPQISRHSSLSRYALLVPYAGLIKEALTSRHVSASTATALLTAPEFANAKVFTSDLSVERMLAIFSWFGFTSKPSADSKGAYDLECSEEFEAALGARLASELQIQKEVKQLSDRIDAIMMKDFPCYALASY